KPRRGGAGRFFAWFNRGFDKSAGAYIRGSAFFIRKIVVGGAALALFFVLAAGLGRRLPTSFVPEEDYGYLLLNVQLPPAASIERTDAVCRKIDQLLARTDGVANFNTIVGFSLLSRVTAGNYGFYFIGLKPWAERDRPELEARGIVNTLKPRDDKHAPV